MHNLPQVHFPLWLLLVDEIHRLICNSCESLLGLQIPNCFGLQLCFFKMEVGLLLEKYWFIFSCHFFCHALLFCAIAGIRQLKKKRNYELQVVGFCHISKNVITLVTAFGFKSSVFF